MEYVLVWILVFAGATIGLLATFLIASERELRDQQDEAAKRIIAAEADSERAVDGDIPPNPIVEQQMLGDAQPRDVDESALRSEISKLQTWLADAQARNFEIDTAYQRVGEEAGQLRQRLAELEKELGAHRSAAERWVEAGRTLSEIMGKRAAAVKHNEEIEAALVRLAALLTDESARGKVAESNGVSHRPNQNDETDQPFTNDAKSGASFAAVEVAKSDSAANETGSDTLWQKNRTGVVAISVFVLIVGTLGTQAWRLQPAPRANPLLSSVAMRPEPMTVQPHTVADEIAKRTTADTQVAPRSDRSSSRKLTRGGDVNLQQSDPLLKKTSLSTRMAPKPMSSAKKVPSSEYATIRPGRVYRAPDEKSAAVGQVEAGMEVLVVSAQSGWLEIRSKHGRAPGYIRSDIAVPQIAQ